MNGVGSYKVVWDDDVKVVIKCGFFSSLVCLDGIG